MSHYIWNRAERVDEKIMPNILTRCFVRWSKEQYARLKLTSNEKKRENILKTIVKQRKNYENAVKIFKLKNQNHSVI